MYFLEKVFDLTFASPAVSFLWSHAAGLSICRSIESVFDGKKKGRKLDFLYDERG